MKITKIIIENYKSIKYMEIPMSNDYGESDAVFLLGINESGKSNILEAIYKLRTGFGEGEEFHEGKFYEVCHKSAQDEEETAHATISAYVQLSKKEQLSCQDLIAEKFPALKNDAKKILIKEVMKVVFCTKDNWGSSFVSEVSLDGDIALEKYVKTENSIIPADSVEESAGDSVEPLTAEDIESFISDQCEDVLNASFPTVRFWKPSSEHLITAPIDLSEYLVNSSVSEPLTCIFFLYGKKDKDSINNTIEMALVNDEKKSELQDKLSKVITRHINSVWKEHQVNIKIKIDGSLLKVHVEDVDAEHTYYNMNQRSDGFKNFISLLLSLSAWYEGKLLNNNVLLLDEPEAGMHPSGVRFMRNEILKMGHSNQVFVATHSPSMIDLEMPRRHWIVEKKKMETSIRFIENDMSVVDEEVMRLAFGIDIMKELLPNNMILVEGEGDRALIQFALNNLDEADEHTDMAIIPARGASKIYTHASVLNDHKVRPVILLDADDEGKRTKEEIIRKLASFDKSRVFTLTDLVTKGLPSDATIEDLLPAKSVKQCLEANRLRYPEGIDVTSNSRMSVIISNNPELKGGPNKEKVSKIKSQIAERAIKDYSDTDREEYKHLLKLAEVLLEKVLKVGRP